MRRLILIIALLACFLTPSVSNAADKQTTIAAIHWAFCGKKYVTCWLGSEAVRVVACETGHTYSIHAKNGQYLGLFQMGREERKTWGFGHNPWAQALAAYRMYKWTSTHEPGPRWHRWSCRP